MEKPAFSSAIMLGLVVAAGIAAVAALWLLGLSGGETGPATTGAWAQFALAFGGAIAAWVAFLHSEAGHASQALVAISIAVLADFGAAVVVFGLGAQ
jgi:hypothetical protein